MQPAPFWRRMLAFIFDLLVINLVVAWPFQSALQQYALNSFSLQSVIPQRAYFIVFLIFILALLYFTFLEYYIGQTPGQMLLNIKSIENNGRMALWKAFIRNIFILPFFPFYILWIVEPLHLAFYRQRLLERWTNTTTVMADAKESTAAYKLKKVS